MNEVSTDWSRNKLVQFIFFGNYFYGLCAVALSTEANLQQEFPLNEWVYYALVFAVSVLYYTKAYVTSNPRHAANKRSAWYYKNRKLVRASQLLLAASVLLAGSFYAFNH